METADDWMSIGEKESPSKVNERLKIRPEGQALNIWENEVKKIVYECICLSFEDYLKERIWKINIWKIS